MTRLLVLLLAALLTTACDSSSDLDAGPEADSGAATDAGPPSDAGPEADTGVALDAGPADAGPDSDAGPDAPTRADFCERFTRARCAAHESCCGVAGTSYGSINACMTAQRERCDDVFESPLFTDGSLSFDAAGAALVLADAERAAADCTAGESAVVLFRRATFEVAIGTATSGDCAALGSDADRAATFLCDRAAGVECYTRSSGGIVSTCEPSVVDGQSCESAPCVRGSYCNASRICAPRGEGGASCRAGRASDCLHNRCEAMVCAEASLCVRR